MMNWILMDVARCEIFPCLPQRGSTMLGQGDEQTYQAWRSTLDEENHLVLQTFVAGRKMVGFLSAGHTDEE